MRILFVVHQFLPRHAAGTEIYAFHLAKELARRGHEVAIFCTEIHPDRDQYGLGRREHDGLRCWEAVHNHGFESFRHSYADEAMEELFERVLDEERPDLVHFQHLHLHSIGYIDIAKERCLPIVYTLHEYMLMCLRGGQLLRPGLELCEGPEPAACAACADIYPAPEGAPVSGLRRWLARILPWARASGVRAEPSRYLPAVELRQREIAARLPRVDLFVSPSAFLRAKFVERGFIDADRILHSDNGFFLESFERVARKPATGLRVGYVGTIAEYKGIHLIVEACQGLDEPGVSCRIWGDMNTFPDYRDRLLEMERPKMLEFCGRFDNARIGEVLSEIDVLVVPSLWFENSPLTIHEAFLAGVPVVCADRGGMAELVEDGVCGLHFKMGDAGSLREALVRLARDPDLLSRLSRAFPAVKGIAEDTDLMESRYEALLGERIPTA